MRKRARGWRRNGGELTGMRQGRSAASGTLWMRRIDGVDLRAPEVKTTTLRSTGASSGRVRRVCCSTGSWRSSGTRRGSEGVAAATTNDVSALRLVRSAMGERAEGRGEVPGEGERGQGSLGVSRLEGEAGGGRVRLHARHTPASPSGRRLKKQAALAGLGQPTRPPSDLARWAAQQVGPGDFLSLLFSI